MSIDTEIQTMIQNQIDEQDFVSRLNAEQYTDNEITVLNSDLQDDIAELMVRLEALESQPAAEESGENKAFPASSLAMSERMSCKKANENLLQELADSAPRAENQIDWIMTPTNIISGYDSKALLLSYIRSVLEPNQSHQSEMVVGMVLATARNLIDKQLKGES